MHSTEGVYNNEWAKAANLDHLQFNNLELKILKSLEWNVNVSRDEFDWTLEGIETVIGWREGRERRWFTYSEMIFPGNDSQFRTAVIEFLGTLSFVSCTLLTP
jgi:hypothetical protein